MARRTLHGDRGSRCTTKRRSSFADGAEVAVVVSDISQGGFKLTSEEILQVGERVSLRDRQCDALAEIRWVRGFKAGGQFLTRTPHLK